MSLKRFVHRAPVDSKSGRVASMDQVRGYAVFGMVFVNVWGLFEASPWLLKHHETGYSYADSIAPLFIFVVGMGFRLSLTSRVTRDGWHAAHRHAAMRYLLLMGLGLLYGGFNLRTGVWDALMDIGAAGMLALPWLTRPCWWRATASVLYLAAYEALFRCTGYGMWEMANSINGGPLGPLSWVFLLLWGSIAWDITAPGHLSRSLPGCVALAALFLALGWLLHVPWGEFKPLWAFSQPWMTSPYTVFSVGLCFGTLALFIQMCDVARLRLPHMTALGRNPLFLYLLQALLVIVLRLCIPRDLPLWGIALSWAAVYTVVYGVAHHFYRRGIVVKL